MFEKNGCQTIRSIDKRSERKTFPWLFCHFSKSLSSFLVLISILGRSRTRILVGSTDRADRMTPSRRISWPGSFITTDPDVKGWDPFESITATKRAPKARLRWNDHFRRFKADLWSEFLSLSLGELELFKWWRQASANHHYPLSPVEAFSCD